MKQVYFAIALMLSSVFFVACAAPLPLPKPGEELLGSWILTGHMAGWSGGGLRLPIRFDERANAFEVDVGFSEISFAGDGSGVLTTTNDTEQIFAWMVDGDVLTIENHDYVERFRIVFSQDTLSDIALEIVTENEDFVLTRIFHRNID